MTTANTERTKMNATLAEPVENFKDGMEKVGRAVSGVAHQTATDVKKTGGQIYDQVYGSGEQRMKKLEKQVKAEPMKAILISAGIGALVGMFLRR